jgi:hypothetical protein
VSVSCEGWIPSTGTISGCCRKYAESDPSIGIMSRGTVPIEPGPVTATAGVFRGGRAGPSLGARKFTHVVDPTTAQKSVAHRREMRAALSHHPQRRCKSARRDT